MFCLPVLTENVEIKKYKRVILPVILYVCEICSHTKGRTYIEGV